MTYIIQIFSYLIVNFFILFYFKTLSQYFDLFDYPNKGRKKQIKPVSLLGGFIFVVNFSMVLFFDLIINDRIFINYLGLNTNLKLFSFIFLFFFIYLIGYSDDKFDLRPFSKLLLVTFCLYLIINNNQNFVINSIRTVLFSKEVDLFYLGPPFTIICILCYINAMNMFDGINLISFLHFFLIALVILIDNSILIFSLVFICSLLFFAYLNLKNLSYLGDSGVYVLSLVSAILLINFYKINNLNAEQILIIIYLPLVDFFRLFFTRIYKGRSPLLPDEKHFHHLLIKNYKFKKTIIIIFMFMYLPVLLNYLIGNTILILFVSVIAYLIFIFMNTKKKLAKT